MVNGANLEGGNDVNISSLASSTLNSVQDSFEQNIKTKKYTLIVDKKDTVRTTLTAGNDVNIQSTLGDVTLKAVDVKAGGKVELAALNGNVNLSANKDVDFRHEVKTETGGMWTTVTDQGRLDETVQHTTIDAGDGLTITVGTNGSVNVDYKDFGNLDKSIERLSQEPGLEWMAQVKSGATPAQWNAIKEAHQSWDYKSQSLSPQAAMIITMIATAVTMGAGAMFGTAAQASLSLGGMATQGVTNATLQAALTAGINTLAVSATVSTVANKGNLGKVFKDLASKESLRNLATAMVTAGLLQGIGSLDGINLDYNSTLLAERIKVAAVEVAVKTAVQSTVGGQDFGDTLKYNLITAGAQVASAELSEQIGRAFHTGKIGPAARLIAHAAIGCGAGAATNGDCAGGAAGAVVAEVISDAYLQEASLTLNDPESTLKAHIIGSHHRCAPVRTNGRALITGFGGCGGGCIGLAFAQRYAGIDRAGGEGAIRAQPAIVKIGTGGKGGPDRGSFRGGGGVCYLMAVSRSQQIDIAACVDLGLRQPFI